jgi:UDP-glucose 4-epimerase/UDP-arabinose 4-epimerase
MALQGHISDFALYGVDYETPDGTAVRDYIHVDDLAAVHIIALDLLLNGDAGGTFNVGTGAGFSVRQILDAVQAETGKVVPRVTRARRAGDPHILVADPTNAEHRPGFKAKHSNLPHIIRSAWLWHQRAHPNSVTS